MPDLVRVSYSGSGRTSRPNPMGMRPMQERVYEARAAQFLLVKAPAPSGKSWALIIVAIDKMQHQRLAKKIACVPETSIGATFRSTRLTDHGFFANWAVEERWNLCVDSEEGPTKGKVRAVKDFMRSLVLSPMRAICLVQLPSVHREPVLAEGVSGFILVGKFSPVLQKTL